MTWGRVLHPIAHISGAGTALKTSWLVRSAPPVLGVVAVYVSRIVVDGRPVPSVIPYCLALVAAVSSVALVRAVDRAGDAGGRPPIAMMLVGGWAVLAALFCGALARPAAVETLFPFVVGGTLAVAASVGSWRLRGAQERPSVRGEDARR